MVSDPAGIGFWYGNADCCVGTTKTVFPPFIFLSGASLSVTNCGRPSVPPYSFHFGILRFRKRWNSHHLHEYHDNDEHHARFCIVSGPAIFYPTFVFYLEGFYYFFWTYHGKLFLKRFLFRLNDYHRLIAAMNLLDNPFNKNGASRSSPPALFTPANALLQRVPTSLGCQSCKGDSHGQMERDLDCRESETATRCKKGTARPSPSERQTAACIKSKPPSAAM